MGGAGDILRRFYEAVVAKDLGAARALLADDLVFEGLFETYRGADAYIRALTGLLGITIRLDVKRIIAEGDQAAVFFGLQTGAPAKATVLVAEWHQVSRGKIAHVASAFDGRPYEAMFTGRQGTPRPALAADTLKDEEAIRELKEVFARAFLAKDAHLRASTWAEDGTVVPPQGGLYRGREAMAKHFQTEAGTITATSKASFSNYRFRFLAPDAAFVEADLSLHDVVGPDGRVRSHLPVGVVFTAVRRDDVWQVLDERASLKPQPFH
jgi:uncharacterized protein (TIGR02246 family)